MGEKHGTDELAARAADAVRQVVAEAEERATEIIRDAEAKAASIREQAEAEAAQTKERGEERHEDQEQDPGRLSPPGHAVVAEQVADDREQDHQPCGEDEDLENGEQHLPEGDVSENQSRFLHSVFE